MADPKSAINSPIRDRATANNFNIRCQGSPVLEQIAQIDKNYFQKTLTKKQRPKRYRVTLRSSSRYRQEGNLYPPFRKNNSFCRMMGGAKLKIGTSHC
ncbi:hypothetical protein NPIL_250091 [Nephila pilipes]|uniref:Uncharacterized protein n=1 Tax=Nephila pilipes TaxID=299642 RepID=A0A8X6NJ13_NEPPI|nr:hypothetical protein NPIL_250091 [Nephila pilipes]